MPKSKPLVIVESPAKARTIAGYLGADYVVESSVGHIRDLPSNASEVPKKYKGTDAGRLGIDVENHFQPIYVIPKKKKDVVKELKDALKGASELYLATDEDREGEAISWHVLEVLGPDVPVRRMVFHEITRTAIEEAIQNWRELDMKLVEAQEGRRVLDRLVGYEMSPVLWKKMMPRLSAGRVQSVATRLVVERERARMAFRAAEYWDLEGTFQPAVGGADKGGRDGFPATLVELDGSKVASGRDFDPATGQVAADARGGDPVVHLQQAEAEALVERLRDVQYRVASVESKAFTERPKAPFTTSTLQQEAGRKLRFSAGRTMRVAQGLYERGYVTYVRTDSTNLSDQAINGAREQIRNLYGDAYLPDAPRTYQGKVKNAQEAHEAIRPAGEHMRSPDEVHGELGADERRLYQLVWMRTLASQMTDARARRVSDSLVGDVHRGRGTRCSPRRARRTSSSGSGAAYVEGADDPAAEREEAESPMPPLAEGDAVSCDTLAAAGHNTQPPARYTEASLVKELEERGIGRPSTYASVIQTITHERGYVWKKGSALGAVMDGVRQAPAHGAVLPASRRLRLHRHDGRGARPHRQRRRRLRELAARLLLRERPARAQGSRRRGAPRRDRPARGQHGRDREGRRGPDDQRAGRASSARTSNATTSARRSPTTSRPTSSPSTSPSSCSPAPPRARRCSARTRRRGSR